MQFMDCFGFDLNIGDPWIGQANNIRFSLTPVEPMGTHL
jgi:hypothetical protein